VTPFHISGDRFKTAATALEHRYSWRADEFEGLPVPADWRIEEFSEDRLLNGEVFLPFYATRGNRVFFVGVRSGLCPDADTVAPISIDGFELPPHVVTKGSSSFAVMAGLKPRLTANEKLLAGILSGQRGLAERALAEGANLSARARCADGRNELSFPLEAACLSGDIKTVRWLIDRGANLADGSPLTTLLVMIRPMYDLQAKPVLDELLAKGARVNGEWGAGPRTSWAWRPLDLAIEHRLPSCALALAKAGALPTASEERWKVAEERIAIWRSAKPGTEWDEVAALLQKAKARRGAGTPRSNP
jgi:hypothetical protein